MWYHIKFYDSVQNKIHFATVYNEHNNDKKGKIQYKNIVCNNY